MTSLHDVASTLEREEVPSLADFAEDSGGAWPKGWYKAEIIEGYSTPKGKQFFTENNTSKNGDSINMRLCFRVTNAKGDQRNIQEQFNFRPTDFTPDRLTFIKEVRQEYKGVRGRWADSDAQRSSLAIAKIATIEKALTFSLRDRHGNTQPARAVGHSLDVRLGINEEGYNEITGFDVAGAKAR